MVNHATSVSARGISRETQDKKKKKNSNFEEEEEEERVTLTLFSVRLPRNANATLAGSPPPHKMMRPCTNTPNSMGATTALLPHTNAAVACHLTLLCVGASGQQFFFSS